MALYHWLDPFWSRFPWPDRISVEEKVIGPVTRFRVARKYLGRKMMATHFYAVGDTLIDSAFPAAGKEILARVAEGNFSRLLLTHHHEDHAGNAKALLAAGLEVIAGEQTCQLLAHEMPLPFYQHLVWGRTRPLRLAPNDSKRVRVGDYEAEVIPAPGHAVDQRVFLVREEGWLFSGDLFIHERVKVFRRDEDFAASRESLERIVELDFESLFCGHRPVIQGGREALKKKLEWFRELEGEVRRLDDTGVGVSEIVKRLRLERSAGFRRLSMGDASAHNLVRSILRGPIQRREVGLALGASAPT